MNTTSITASASVTTLNIIDLIEKNPITLLSNTYQNKLLTKIKEKFTDNEQQMFIASFYCYLNYQDEFVVDLDDIWKWLGFNTKQNSKRLLENQFIINKDYILVIPNDKQSSHIKGGHNKETIMLNIATFKKFCLKAGTKKADEIHDYYIKLEKTLQEVLLEESNELKLQLEQKDKLLENAIQDKGKLREKTILEHFPKNTQCVYYGLIDNVSNQNEKLIKFGNSNNLKNRVTQHRDTYSNFRLINAFKVDNKLQIENAIKCNDIFIERQRTITIKQKKYVEILNIQGITFPELDKIIKDIITSIEYSPENYIKLLDENKLLRTQIDQKNITNNTTQVILLTGENQKLQLENIKLIKQNHILQTNYDQYKTFADKYLGTSNHVAHVVDQQYIASASNVLTHNTLINQYEIDINAIKNTSRCKKNAQGTYNLDGKIFTMLCGTREEVYSEKAYKTTGGLTKNDLLINKHGKVISKKKFISETQNNHLDQYNANKNAPTKP
jgi:phage anti-repressor protein